ncbi:hypothetical protein VIGAN_06109700 [Vigna angularis var. angularis]|uniref:Uncharacterized protein n=1 Tax=Vigna angularis var. angularis TaxID=157739 RepID=A0A0S3SAX4_PHAAN|nr:hypothetical protein VIGAN_06109700 [Vigna angularis var. angularis]
MMLSYPREVVVLYELLYACLSDLSENHKKHGRRLLEGSSSPLMPIWMRPTSTGRRWLCVPFLALTEPPFNFAISYHLPRLHQHRLFSGAFSC